MNRAKSITILSFLIINIFIVSLIFFTLGHQKGEKLFCKVQSRFKIKTPCKEGRFLEKKANSFSYILKKVLFPKYKGRTAAVFLNETKTSVFTQRGEHWQKSGIIKSHNPIQNQEKPVYRAVFSFQNQKLALLEKRVDDCIYASIIDVQTQKPLFDAHCIPDHKNSSFRGVGGGFTTWKDGFLLAIGVPSGNSEIISNLAQDKESPYGKIHYFKFSENKDKLVSTFFSMGHRNPQGIQTVNGSIFSVEHGPRGGDEINHIVFGQNYGWPKFSLGVPYKEGSKSYKHIDTKNNFKNPIFSFVPSVGLSDITSCPKILKDYYNNFYCLILSSLKGRSLYIALIDKEKKSLVSMETLYIGYRIREFARGDESEDSITFASDYSGIYKVQFKNFRPH